MVTPLHNDALLLITQFADWQTLATLRLVSKLFDNSEELHWRLFGLEHPNLNLTQIQIPSWKELRIQRALAERNLLSGLCRKEPINCIPPKADDVEIQVLQERPFIAYSINCSDCIEEKGPPTFFLYEVQKKKLLSFPIPLPFTKDMDTGFFLEELHSGIHVTIRCFYANQCIFFLLKVGDEGLTKIQQYTTNEQLTSFKWIFCEKANSFRLAMTVENRLQISTTSTACITHHLDAAVRIAGHFFWGEHSLLLLHFPNKDIPEETKISVYDLDSFKECFILDAPQFSVGPAKVLLQGQELTIFQYGSNSAYFFKVSSFPGEMPCILDSKRFLANAGSMLTYLNGKKRYMTVLDSPTTQCKSLYLSTHDSWKFTDFFVFPTAPTLTLCESQGLPTLLAVEFVEELAEDSEELPGDSEELPEDSEELPGDSEEVDEDRTRMRTNVYALNFNFTPTSEEKRANTALKIDAFIRKYWRQIRSAFGDVSLLAFFLWKTRRKSP